MHHIDAACLKLKELKYYVSDESTSTIMIFLPFFYMSLCRSWLEKVGILRTLLQSSTPTGK
jgi:hypothetical protein